MIEETQIITHIQSLAGVRAQGVRVTDDSVSMMLDISGLTPEDAAALDTKIRQAMQVFPDIASVRIAQTAQAKTRKVIAVGSGKGGVGKSTIAANLAVATRPRIRKRMRPSLSTASNPKCRAKVLIEARGASSAVMT